MRGDDVRDAVLRLAMLVEARHGCDSAELHVVFAPVAMGSLGLHMVPAPAKAEAGGPAAKGSGPAIPPSLSHLT